MLTIAPWADPQGPSVSLYPSDSIPQVGPTVATPKPETRDFLKLASDHGHWLITLADTKASYLMAASAILAGLLAQQAFLTCSDIARGVLLIAVALGLSGAVAALLVLFPRTTPVLASSLLYFPAIKAFKSGADYYERVKTIGSTDTDRELAQQTWELALTENKKFYWLRWAFRLFGASLVPSLIGIVGAHLGCA